MANAYAQLKYETAPGYEGSTDTLSTKTIYPPLIGLKFALNPSPLKRDDEMRGNDDAVPQMAEMLAPSWDLTCRLYPDVAGFFLKAMLGAPVTTAGNGVLTDPDAVVMPTGVYRHVWTAPFGPSGISPQTMQAVLAWKDQGVFYRVKGMVTESLSISTPKQGGVQIKLAGRATYAVKIADPALTPAPESIAVKPFLRAGATLPTWLTGSGTTQDFDLSLTNPVTVDESYGSGSKYPDLVEKGDGVITTTGVISKRQLDQDDLDALVAVSGFAAIARWTNESFAFGTYPHKLYASMANAQYVDGAPDDLSNKRRLGGSFSFAASNAGTASTVLTLVNATASYA